MGDADYMYAFQNLVMPVAIEFDPDLVIGQFIGMLIDIWKLTMRKWPLGLTLLLVTSLEVVSYPQLVTPT